MRFTLVVLLFLSQSSFGSSQEKMTVIRSGPTRAIRLDSVSFDLGEFASIHPYLIDESGQVLGHLRVYRADELVKGVSLALIAGLPSVDIKLSKKTSSLYEISASWLSLKSNDFFIKRVKKSWKLFYQATLVNEISFNMSVKGPQVRVNGNAIH